MAKQFKTFEDFLEAYRDGRISQTALIHDMEHYPRRELESYLIELVSCQKDLRDDQRRRSEASYRKMI